MIISRTPYRISLFGGSTDYEEFYSQNCSLLIGMAIDKYSYLSGRKTPSVLPYKSRFSYSQSEIIDKTELSDEDYLDKIRHNGIRGVLDYLNATFPMEMSHFCDIPSQTGLGSSSSFVVGLLKLVHEINEKSTRKEDLARQAIYIERKLLKEAGGIQDQIWAAYGGFNSIEINREGKFKVKPLPISEEFTNYFIECSALIYTGSQRNSFQLATHPQESSTYKNEIKTLAEEAYSYFEVEYLEKIGGLLAKSWEAKKKINQGISNAEIDDLYTLLVNHGMIGGKLLGSGASGFIYALFPRPDYLHRLPQRVKDNIVVFNVDYEGSKIIYK